MNILKLTPNCAWRAGNPMNSSKIMALVSTTAALTLLIPTSTAYSAEGSDSRSVLLNAIQQASPDLLSQAQAMVGKPENDRVAIHLASDPAVQVTTAAGQEISVHLPISDRPDYLDLGAGIVAFDTGNDSHIVPLVTALGTVAILSVLEGPSSSASQRYELDLPVGATLHKGENGGVLVLDTEGGYLAAIAPPWAKDSQGGSVPTSYEIDGTALVQNVKLPESPKLYPVVADPYLGVDLISTWSWSGSKAANTEKIRVWVTPMMGVAWVTAGGYNTFIWGWSELLTKVGSRVNYTTYYQQFGCHAVYAPGTLWDPYSQGNSTWDLEYWRGTNANYLAVWNHQCNW